MAATRKLLAFALFSLFGVQCTLATPVPRQAASNLAVDLVSGIYQGVYNSTTGLNVWKGIPYAAPPLGNLRWQPPTAPAAQKATINATAYGPVCPQAGPAPSTALTLGNEDCLYLNVWAPTIQPGKELPVLVWIHGGGYGAGNGRTDMSEIIGANGNAFVAVTIQYRLGAFGFLSSAELASNGVVNAGLLDMAFALQWVQDHIGQFGGDRDRVTISGESAGGGAVMQLSIAKGGSLGTSLFRGVIAASPYLPPQYDYNASIPTKFYQDFASRAGCSNATSGTVACLKSQNSTILQTANVGSNSVAFFGNWAFLPVTDYGFATTLPSAALTEKHLNGEHIMVGNNANEGPLFVPRTINTTDALTSWLQGAFPDLNSTSIQGILNAYPGSDNSSGPEFATNGLGPATALTTSQLATGPQQRADNIYAEATFVCPSYWLNDAFGSGNRTSYHYQYSVPVSLHGNDVSAYFGPATPNQPPVFTTAFRQIWGNFTQRAAPAVAVPNLTWPAWVEGQTSQMLNLNVTGGTPYVTAVSGFNVTQYMGPGVQNDFSTVNAWTWEGGRGQRCEVWRGIAAQVPI